MRFILFQLILWVRRELDARNGIDAPYRIGAGLVVGALVSLKFCLQRRNIDPHVVTIEVK